MEYSNTFTSHQRHQHRRAHTCDFVLMCCSRAHCVRQISTLETSNAAVTPSNKESGMYDYKI